MKQSHKIAFIVAFLAIIYALPAVQTIAEYRNNAGHRIQILDLPTDIFLTPMRNAHIDNRAMDTLAILMAVLTAELTQGAKADSTAVWNSENAITSIDEARIALRQLKRNVINYNRHLQDERNIFLKTDTITPYFNQLKKIEVALSTIQSMVEDDNDRQAARASADSLAKVATDLKTTYDKPMNATHFFELTMKALSRTMVGADYLRPYEKEMEKSSMFANAVRPWMQFAYFTMFNDLGDKAILGEKEWYFYRPDVEYLTKPSVFDRRSVIVDANDIPIRDAIIDSIAAFKQTLADKGVELLVVVMPGKPSIYPDMLSDKLGADLSGKIGPSLDILNRLNKAGVSTVDLFSSLAQERKNDAIAGDSLYLHTDTHFKHRGVLVTAKVIADRVKTYAWYTPGTTEYAVDSIIIPRAGDVAEMTKLSALKIHQVHCSFATEQTMCKQVYRITRDEKGDETERALYRDDFSNSQVLVLGDSYSRIYQTDEPRSAGWISHLAKELNQPVASLVNDGGASTLVRQTLARKPQMLKNKKLVVWEIVERDFRFGAEGWKNITL